MNTNMPTKSGAVAESVLVGSAETLGGLTAPRISSNSLPKVAKPIARAVDILVIALNEMLFAEAKKHGIRVDVAQKDRYCYLRISGMLPCRKCKRLALFEDVSAGGLCKDCE
jgi:hypothetical protein